ncbi:CelD/BcsL family acetyltransferase involved in cellulose biosynthesis [Pararhizobium capsulatum DSM 1112]|uniref:CelD/BcsL family acetyltransferase involved in cellulose biosynthesis n=1 Tax=Pararhizobium capsulatum DSM 1112 TaxID=1121113 RepID=A0ABU0BQU8_9HYPH|nr:GNAT family N-acetyltransferase [Pararhizobium capsulatum]MDQ0319865.1 CelD/BcsL family acetyltransferase involved in cellulose biosynthesis [Pararhizobium capsulatum DSM 1112]
MSGVRLNIMPANEAPRRVWQTRRTPPLDLLALDAVRDDFSLSVHVSLDRLEDEWRALEQGSQNSLHQSFDWCAAWAATHENQLLLVRGRVGQDTAFILPLELIRGRFFQTVRFIGSDHSNINTGIFARDFDPAADGELAAKLISELSLKLARLADIVTLEKIPLAWRGFQHPFAALPAVRNQNSSYQLPLFESFEKTLTQVNAKRRRKKFRVSEKRLQALGGYEYVVATSHDESRRLLCTFFQQKAERFKTMGLPNVFQDAETQAFFKDLAARPREHEHRPLELHAIRLKGENAGRVIAIAGVSRKGDHVICQFGSIDETLATDCSPGEFLFHLMIERCCREGAALFDFGIGDQPYKRSWCTVETAQYDIVLPLTARGRLAAYIHRTIVRSKAAIKKNRRIYNTLQKIRQQRQTSAKTTDTDAEE